jgi:hypothetical protein
VFAAGEQRKFSLVHRAYPDGTGAELERVVARRRASSRVAVRDIPMVLRAWPSRRKRSGLLPRELPWNES